MLTHPLEGEGVDSPSLYLCFFFCLYMFSSQFVPIHFTFALPPPHHHHHHPSTSACTPALSASFSPALTVFSTCFWWLIALLFSISLFFFFCSTCPLHYFALGTYSSPVFSLSLSIYSLYVTICISSCVKKSTEIFYFSSGSNTTI